MYSSVASWKKNCFIGRRKTRLENLPILQQNNQKFLMKLTEVTTVVEEITPDSGESHEQAPDDRTNTRKARRRRDL